MSGDSTADTIPPGAECRCADIMAADSARHFKGCPLRAPIDAECKCENAEAFGHSMGCPWGDPFDRLDRREEADAEIRSLWHERNEAQGIVAWAYAHQDSPDGYVRRDAAKAMLAKHEARLTEALLKAYPQEKP